MQGNLKQIALPEVLQFISMGKSTGLLSVKDRQAQETTLMIRQGRIINSSALERQRRLGDLLVHRGILKRSVLAQVLNIQRTVETEKRIGEILVERDIIQESQIRDVLRLQLEEEIWNLFALEEGEFKFEQVDEDKLGEPTVQIDIEPLLLEGSRRQDEWRRINRVLPSERAVVALKPPAPGADLKPRLTAGEWRVLAAVNGKLPIRGIINRSALGRFEVYKIIAELLGRGLVYLKPEEAMREEVLEKIEEMQREPAAAVATARASAGMGGLLARFRTTATRRPDDNREKLNFISPVGCLAYFINQMIDQFQSQKEFRGSPADQNLLPSLWQDLIISFTKADLIFPQKNHIQADRFEEFLRLFENNEAMADSFEDSLQALLQLLDALYRIYSQRVGERTGTKIIRDLLDDISPRVTLLFGSDFKLDERIQMVLRLAA